MSISGERTDLKLVTVGDFDPQSDQAIEYDFIGRVIAGRYTVRAHIGGGGMADVYRATDEQLGVDVVIKLLKPRMASDELRARMVQEARAAAQVRHDHLVRVFVIDLGLVKPDRALRCATSPPTTEVGRMLCTPGYTSPEQAAGLPVDRRSDVYSMGVTLYRVLAGRLPFHDARGQPVEVVLAKHIYNEPTRLTKAAKGADVPPAIAEVIESALRKVPNDRPRTILAFAEALRAAAAGVPLRAKSRRWPYELLIPLCLGVVVAWLAKTLVVSPPTVVVASDPSMEPRSTATPAPDAPGPIVIPEVPEELDPILAAPETAPAIGPSRSARPMSSIAPMRPPAASRASQSS